jgi:hypothetical protein
VLVAPAIREDYQTATRRPRGGDPLPEPEQLPIVLGPISWAILLTILERAGFLVEDVYYYVGPELIGSTHFAQEDLNMPRIEVLRLPLIAARYQWPSVPNG